jgi:hypothetical protein
MKWVESYGTAVLPDLWQLRTLKGLMVTKRLRLRALVYARQSFYNLEERYYRLALDARDKVRIELQT